MAMLTKNTAVLTEDEFRKFGGSQVTIDLSKLTDQRVRDAIRSVAQIAPDQLTMLAVHSAGVMSAIMENYIFLCCKEKRLLDPAEVMNSIMEGMANELTHVREVMSEKEENGKSRFDNMKRQYD